MESALVLHAACGTHPGQLRKINQDSVLAIVRESALGDPLGLLIVADGMGGHQAGEIASQLAVSTIKKNLAWMIEQDASGETVIRSNPQSVSEELESEHFERRLELAIKEANRVIYDYSKENPDHAGNLGCTVTCAIVHKDTATIANVGDSRTYRWRKGKLTQITQDHSYVWQLVSEGYIEEYEIFDHPQRNVITRALGNQSDVTVDLWSCSLESGDRLLLCSDGMWEMIREPAEIAKILEVNPLQKVVNQLIESANGYGGHDNIGIVVAEINKTEKET